MSHQTGIRANEDLKKFFGNCRDGTIRTFKISIENEGLDPDLDADIILDILEEGDGSELEGLSEDDDRDDTVRNVATVIDETQEDISNVNNSFIDTPVSWNKVTFEITFHTFDNDDRMYGVPEIKTPLQYFLEYYPEDYFQNAADCTAQYCLQKKQIQLKTDATEIKKLYGMHLVMGCIPYPRLRMYWQSGISMDLITSCSIKRDKFFLLRNCLHVVDVNKPPDNRNRLWKVQPVLDTVLNGCHKIERQPGNYSIDEQMVPFTGRCSLKQYVPNKPRPVGLKNFVVTTSDGLMIDFELYQGSESNFPLKKELGLGPSVVLRLKDSIPPLSILYFDRYFTTLGLLQKLYAENFFATGTIMTNRLKVINFCPDRDLPRGNCEEFCTSDGKIVAVKWKDNKCVTMLSSVCGSSPVTTVKRWSKKEYKFVEIQCPAVVTTYNKNMGGVDLLNQLLECYRTWFKTKKWTLKVILHFLDLSVVNCWMQYRRDCRKNSVPKGKIMDLLKFRLELAEALMCTPKHSRRNDGDGDASAAGISDLIPVRPQNWRAPIPGIDKRLDGYDHWPIVDDLTTARACRLKDCKSRTRMRCEKCNVYLCLTKDKNCFKYFHTNK